MANKIINKWCYIVFCYRIMNILPKVSLKYQSLFGWQMLKALRRVSNDAINANVDQVTYFKQLGR